MAVYPFLGMRGIGEFNDDARPQSWREKILELFPNGSAPLTAITSMTGRSEAITDERHNWKTRTMSTQAGAVTSVYIDSGLGTEYVYASHQSTHGIAGETVYAKVALATAKQFREGHQVILRDSDRYGVDVNAKVVNVFHNGASSVVACKLLEADDNDATASSYNLATVDRILVVGNMNVQGGVRPPAITYDPTDVYNITQIWRTPLQLSGTAMATKLRGRDAYLDAKEQALLYHSIEMEKSLIWSIRSSNTGGNGNHENTVMGINQFINTYASANVDSFKLSSSFSGKTWLESGEEWLDGMLKTIFSQGKGNLGDEAIAFCGAGALLGIQRLIKSSGMYTLTEKTKAYGLNVVEWMTPFGSVNLKIHPLFSWETTNDYSILVVPPKHIVWHPLGNRDTHFKPDRLYDEGGAAGVDGKQEEFLTEGTYEYFLDGPWGYLNGVGENNTV